MICMAMAMCVSCKKDGDHEYVDLGLPSGLLWATCNVGANSPEDDAAHVNWGGAWRMPTIEEMDELENNCTWTWTTQSGKNGYRVTGPNGKSIFMPAAGHYLVGFLHDADSYGHYWSGSLNTYNQRFAYDLDFDLGRVYASDNYRIYGRSVRPVCPSQS